ncbi:MAG: sigma 54-interacting transcriptional regulator [Bacteroidia bacterium]|nr:sigma 54-interacting transcriptional regulator [Bacteroidia bacterium]
MNIYITWHLPTYGIGYTKTILSAFFKEVSKAGNSEIRTGQLSQEEMASVFSANRDGYLFDKVFYLYPDQKIEGKIKTHRPHRKKLFLEEKGRDSLIQNSPTFELWKECLERDFNSLEEEIEFFRDKLGRGNLNLFSRILNEYWRNIYHYPIEDQIKWFSKYSNASPLYDANRFVPVNMTKEFGLKDMRDYRNIMDSVSEFLNKNLSQSEKDSIVINVSLGSYETQVAWFISAEAGLLPRNTKFISIYDLKDDEETDRFRPFQIKEVPVFLIQELRGKFSIFPETKSPPRKLANKKIKSYLNSGFAILILGPRGIGKTRMVQENSEMGGLKVVSANCASFADDTMAEAELFGFKRGAFTGATADKPGLFSEANGGILFLDEIHHLSGKVQAKLMTALQTNHKNQFAFRQIGGAKESVVEFRVVMATNRPISELKKVLLPDFFDRIAQHIVEIPPLSQTQEDRENDWRAVWQQMQFGNADNAPNEKGMMEWLKSLGLPGNFRDLQKIAIYYRSYMDFDGETREMIPEKNAFDFAKSEYERYQQTASEFGKFKFSSSATSKQMISEFKRQMAEWATKEFGGKTKAAQHFKDLGEKTTRQAIDTWIKGK